MNGRVSATPARMRSSATSTARRGRRSANADAMGATPMYAAILMASAVPRTAPASAPARSNASRPSATVARPVPSNAITWAKKRCRYVVFRSTSSMRNSFLERLMDLTQLAEQRHRNSCGIGYTQCPPHESEGAGARSRCAFSGGRSPHRRPARTAPTGAGRQTHRAGSRSARCLADAQRSRPPRR